MKNICNNCGNVYEGNFCPYCGFSASTNNKVVSIRQKKSYAGLVVIITLLCVFAFIFITFIIGGILAPDYKTNTNIHTTQNENIDSAENIPYFELTQGEYEVGKDIPAAVYDLYGISGWGFIWVYDDENLFSNKISTKVINLRGENNEYLENMYSLEYNNLRLKEGQFLTIEQTITVGFTAD